MGLYPRKVKKTKIMKILDKNTISALQSLKCRLRQAEWEATHEVNAPMSRLELLESHVDSAGFSMRFANALSRRGIETIKQLLDTSEEELLAISSIGEPTIKAMHKRLKELGFHG